MNRAVLCLLLLFGAQLSSGQIPADSLREYDLEELVVSTNNAPGSFESVRFLELADLAQLVPTSADAAIGYLPSARIQTNSRGETLVYLRNSGERQAAVFLDGAPLNIAWDNRVDLSLVPSGAIGRLSIVTGPSSVLLGTNVTGGAVELISRLPATGSVTEFDGAVGTLGFAHGGARFFGGISGWRLGGVFEYAKRDGLPLTGGSTLDYNQDRTDRRTNSDWRLGSVHFRGQKQLSPSLELGFTLAGNIGQKGIAPESHLDPAQGGVRYWRYPDTDRGMLIVSAKHFTGSWLTKSSAWMQRFSQRIDQYSTNQYLSITDSQQDVDRSAGTRIVTEFTGWTGTVRILGTYLANLHDQTDDSNESPALSRQFRQDVYSLGVEYESSRENKTVVRLGSSLDGYHAPGTRTAGTSRTDFSASIGLRHDLNADFAIRIGGARKVRFPTAREVQDTGLGRFVLNPDLAPETSYLLEAAAEGALQGFSFSVVPFLQRTFDTIDQARVQVDSVTLRQRVNLDGSRVLGMEFIAATNLASRVRLSSSVTLMDATGYDGDVNTRLTERPNVLATASAAVRLRYGLSVSAEIRHTGRAYGLAESGDTVPLPIATLIDSKVAHTIYFSRLKLGIQTYIRIENLLDAESLPQLGLPGSGRFFRFGLSITL